MADELQNLSPSLLEAAVRSSKARRDLIEAIAARNRMRGMKAEQAREEAIIEADAYRWGGAIPSV